MTANLPQAKTHFKRAFKIYEKIWADDKIQSVDITPEFPDILLQSFLVHQPRSFHIF